MTFLPVVGRELRVAARRRQTYWTRFFAALGTLALCTWIWGWLAVDQAASDRGLILFQTVSGLAFAYSLMAGIGITADSLSEEKREGTLGLLFLTDLRGYDVVLGKLVATSLNALYRLFSVFPILAIPLLLGALTFGEFWRMAMVLTNTLLFSLSAGMIVSALSLRERQAMLGTFLLIVVVTAVPPVVGWIYAIQTKSLTFNPTWLLSSSVYPAFLAFDAPYKAHRQLFWSAVATTQVLSWGFLIWASLLVPRAWQDRPAVGRPARRKERWQSWQFGHGTARTLLRRRLLETNSILWLVGRDRLKSLLVYAVLGGLALTWLWLYWKFGNGLLDPTFYILTAYCAHTIIKLWLASEVCRPLVEDRRSGALELILSTPLSVDDILDGHFLALKRQFGGPTALILAADFAMLLAGMSDRVLENSRDWMLLCLALMILFIADLYALAWVGLWLSLVSKKASRAANGTIARILVLPWGILVLALSLMAMIQLPGLDTGEMGLLVFAFAVSLINNAFFLSWARRNLRAEFRQMATQRFDAKGAGDAGKSEALASPAVVPPVLAR